MNSRNILIGSKFAVFSALFLSLGATGRASSLPVYSVGQPTPGEQLYLELINRARANPAAEGLRLRDTTDEWVRSAYDFFSVDLNLMVSQFKAIAPAPPLAFNENLLAAARKHSLDMFQRGLQWPRPELPHFYHRCGLLRFQ